MNIPYIQDFVRSPDFQRLIEQSLEELRIRTAAHIGLWQLDEADWYINQDEGTITFASPNGITVVCNVQVIGTYNIEEGTWLWAWDHPYIEEKLQKYAHVLLEYGKEHAITELEARKLICAEEHAWQFTALACKLCNGQGCYRGPSNSVMVFVVYDEVTIKSIESSS